jgi:hypothetical protein
VPTPLPGNPDAPVTPTTSLPVQTAPQVPAERVAAATASAPSVSVTPTAPDSPGELVAPGAPATTPAKPAATTADTAKPITDLVSSLFPAPVAGGETSLVTVETVAASSAATVPPGGFSAAEGVDLEVPQLIAPVGSAPSGSSLLAVLAGYVLPGSSGPPASTLVMLIVIGLILGVGYAARPELTEALASVNLLGASSGHGMAVRRPG